MKLRELLEKNKSLLRIIIKEDGEYQFDTLQNRKILKQFSKYEVKEWSVDKKYMDGMTECYITVNITKNESEECERKTRIINNSIKDIRDILNSEVNCEDYNLVYSKKELECLISALEFAKEEDRLKELDSLYLEKCEEVNELKEELKRLKRRTQKAAG